LTVTKVAYSVNETLNLLSIGRCPSVADTDRLYDFIREKDLLAASKFHMTHGCIWIDKGTHVTVEDFSVCQGMSALGLKRTS
jgi:hypothetical protein